MCKLNERSFINDIWCSYILRGLTIVSQGGAVVVIIVSVPVSGKGLWVQFCDGAIFFVVPHIYYLFLAQKLAQMPPVALSLAAKINNKCSMKQSNLRGM